jgi:phage terminase large subunit-like protein
VTPDRSPAERIVLRMAAELGAPAAHKALDLMLRDLGTVELAGLEHNWGFWARPRQLLPAEGWRSCGFLGGRGSGKTKPCAQHVVQEAHAGRAMRIALCATSDDDTRDVMIEGKSGLIACSPPHFRAKYEPGNGRVIWPNGAQAFQYSAEAPEHFRGPEHHLFWGTELGAWPKNTADAAWYNMRMGLRLGYARLLWDTTPRSVPLVAKLIARAAEYPQHHLLIRGTMADNWANLPAHFIEEMYAEYGGTRLGLQELEGQYLEDVAGALFRMADIVGARRNAPADWRRRVIAVDPAISTRKGTDRTGIVSAGLGFDDQVYVTRDQSGKHKPEAWGRIVIDTYARDACDCIVVERNRGGDLVAANIRACARESRVEVRMWEDKANPPAHTPGVIHIREVHARRGKTNRAEPVATRYERGKVSHVIGAQLVELEQTMTTWDPSTGDSPDALDALVHAVWELLGLGGAERIAGDYETATVRGRMAAPVRGERLALADTADDDEDDGRDGDDEGGGSRW